MHRRALLSVAILTASFSAVGGYYFGFAALRHTQQVLAAGQDLLTPLSEVRERRLRRAAIRSVAEAFRDYQADYFDAHGAFARVEAIPVAARGIAVSGHERLRPRYEDELVRTEIAWLGEFVYAESRFEVDRCAVALNQEDGYVAGIRLRASGRVRCSWDLATRLNR